MKRSTFLKQLGMGSLLAAFPVKRLAFKPTSTFVPRLENPIPKDNPISNLDKQVRKSVLRQTTSELQKRVLNNPPLQFTSVEDIEKTMNAWLAPWVEHGLLMDAYCVNCAYIPDAPLGLGNATPILKYTNSNSIQDFRKLAKMEFDSETIFELITEQLEELQKLNPSPMDEIPHFYNV